MNAPRVRTRAEVTRDVIGACRRMGEIAMAAEIGQRQPSFDEVERIVDGLRRVIVEYRVAEAQK